MAKPQTACKRGHEFTAESTYVDKNGRRTCRQCAKRRVKESRQRDSLNLLLNQHYTKVSKLVIGYLVKRGARKCDAEDALSKAIVRLLDSNSQITNGERGLYLVLRRLALGNVRTIRRELYQHPRFSDLDSGLDEDFIERFVNQQLMSYDCDLT